MHGLDIASETHGHLVEMENAAGLKQATLGPVGPGRFEWPPGFVPVPDEEWTHRGLDDAALEYDHVDKHGSDSDLNPIADEIAATTRDGDVVLDYSGGTGALLDRVRLRTSGRTMGWLIVDPSARFLRVALEKYRDDPCVGIRRLRFLKDQKRLQRLDEALGNEMLARGVDAIVSTNAIHLYPDLDKVVATWAEILRPGGRLFINSGNVRNPCRAVAGDGSFSDVVSAVSEIAERLVRREAAYSNYRPMLDDAEPMKRYIREREQVFPDPRPLERYASALSAAGLTVMDVRERVVKVDVPGSVALMTAYHESILGWVGGTKKLDGQAAPPGAVEDRLAILRRAIELMAAGRSAFDACWTYITCEKVAKG